MSHCRVVGIMSAVEGTGPGYGPGRPRGAKAAGHRYEAKLAAALPGFRRGVWWRYLDVNGVGWCQTDLVSVGVRAVLVLEAKL